MVQLDRLNRGTKRNSTITKTVLKHHWRTVEYMYEGQVTSSTMEDALDRDLKSIITLSGICAAVSRVVSFHEDILLHTPKPATNLSQGLPPSRRLRPPDQAASARCGFAGLSICLQ